MNNMNILRRAATVTSGIRYALLYFGVLAISPVALCTGVFKKSGSLTIARSTATATLLADGKVLITAGESASERPGPTSTAEIYDPVTQTSIPTGTLNSVRSGHVATLLLNNQVLVTGGNNYPKAELFDPSTGTWTDTSPFLQLRENHTATLLKNGNVLLVGGAHHFNHSGAEIYDPQTDTWTLTGPLGYFFRTEHTATLLQDGKVLVVGGSDFFTSPFSRRPLSAEIYDPSTGRWTRINSPSENHHSHTATLLPNGKVLIIGGSDSGSRFPSSELYDPSTGQWSFEIGSREFHRGHHAVLLPNNTILITGRGASTQIYDPESRQSSNGDPLIVARGVHTSTLLMDGRVLITGGSFAATEIYSPTPFQWTSGASTAYRSAATATLLDNGKLLVAGGFDYQNSQKQVKKLPACDLYDPASDVWTKTGPMTTARFGHTAIKLKNAKILVTGGGTAQAEIYDPVVGSWDSAGSTPASDEMTATLLKNGRILVTGGSDEASSIAASKLYDPSSNSWSNTASLINRRQSHTATLLKNGWILVVGGFQDTSSGNRVVASEIYNPKYGTWSAAASPATPRAHHSATILPSGKVLVWGGTDAQDTRINTSEIYDPSTGTWSITGPMLRSRNAFATARLEDGRVIMAGGTNMYINRPNATCGAEIYDETTGVWTTTAPLITPRTGFAMVPLADGRVLAAGGLQARMIVETPYPGDLGYYISYYWQFIGRVEIYDPILPKMLLKQENNPIPANGTKSFGNLIVGKQTSLQFNLRNTGTADLAGLNVTIDGPNSSVFSISSAPDFENAAPGEDIVFTVTFAPATAGAKAATLQLASNEYSLNFQLIGNAYIPAPEITISRGGSLTDGKSTIKIGSVKVRKSRKSRAAKTFTIKNIGTANLTKLSIRKTGKHKKDFIIRRLGKTTLTPGARTTFKVIFKPRAKGSRHATIHIKSNDADESPFDIKLTGKGVKW